MIPGVGRDRLVEMYRHMLLMRRVEEACFKLWDDGHLPGHYHVYIGEDATGAAVGAVREEGDYLFTTHRNHGHLIACGADPGRVLAEILVRKTGYNGGRGGTLHVAAPDLRIPHTSALVGSCVPIAMGVALALKQRKQGRVSLVMFGDGAMDEGAFCESANMTSLFKLPLILLCENNTWETDPARPEEYPGATSVVSPLTSLAEVYKIRSIAIDGSDLGLVYQTISDALARAREGGGPAFIEARARRWVGTRPLWPKLVTGVMDLAVAWTGQVPEQLSGHREWFLRDDPVLRATREFLATGLLTRGQVEQLDREVLRQTSEAIRFAVESPLPAPEEALERVRP